MQSFTNNKHKKSQLYFVIDPLLINFALRYVCAKL